MKKCAYCGSTKNITREHIIPAYLYSVIQELGKKSSGWIEKAGKAVGGEQTVKDVCSTCNNGVLSDLDSTSKLVFDKAGLLVTNYKRAQVELEFDYDLLLRWLLKVSYNSSRTNNNQSHLFEQYRDYILTGENAPPYHQLSLISLMLAPAEFGKGSFSKLNREEFEKLSGGVNSFNPFTVRVSYAPLRDRQSLACTVRMVSIGPIIFFLLFFNQNTPRGNINAEIRKFLKYEPNISKLLTRERKHVTLRHGKSTWFDYQETQYQIESDALKFQ